MLINILKHQLAKVRICIIAMWLWECHLVSLWLSFLIYKTRVIKCLPHRILSIKGDQIVHMEYYAAERKNEPLSFATAWIDLENIMLSEISQVVKQKYRMILPISGT